jgi:hypothetical protein
MKTILCLSVSLIGLLASVAVASAVDQNATRVTTSRSLRVACVFNSGEAASWRVIQQAFAASMSANLGVPAGTAMPVKMIASRASRAADDLVEGKCDAVLVMSERLPSELLGDKFASVRAVSRVGIPVRVFHLVVLSVDPASTAALSSAFESATSSAVFQEVVGRTSAVHAVASNLER